MLTDTIDAALEWTERDRMIVDAAVGGEVCMITMEVWRYTAAGPDSRREVIVKVWDGQTFYQGPTLEAAYREFLAGKQV